MTHRYHIQNHSSNPEDNFLVVKITLLKGKHVKTKFIITSSNTVLHLPCSYCLLKVCHTGREGVKTEMSSWIQRQSYFLLEPNLL